MQCACTTTKGARCRLRATASGYCKLHTPCGRPYGEVPATPVATPKPSPRPSPPSPRPSSTPSPRPPRCLHKMTKPMELIDEDCPGKEVAIRIEVRKNEFYVCCGGGSETTEEAQRRRHKLNIELIQIIAAKKPKKFAKLLAELHKLGEAHTVAQKTRGIKGVLKEARELVRGREIFVAKFALLVGIIAAVQFAPWPMKLPALPPPVPLALPGAPQYLQLPGAPPAPPVGGALRALPAPAVSDVRAAAAAAAAAATPAALAMLAKLSAAAQYFFPANPMAQFMAKPGAKANLLSNPENPAKPYANTSNISHVKPRNLPTPRNSGRFPDVQGETFWDRVGERLARRFNNAKQVAKRAAMQIIEAEHESDARF